MKRRFIREYADADDGSHGWKQQNIAVTGLSQCVGTTFVASALAFYLQEKGKSVTFCQCLDPADCRSLLYDSMAMEQRFFGRGFIDVYQHIYDGEKIPQGENREEGIGWILPTPANCAAGLRLSPVQKGRLVASARDEVCVYDMQASGWDEFLQDMDLIIAVADPLPSVLIRAKERYAFLKRLELSGYAIEWIVNRESAGVHRRQVRGYLKSGGIHWLKEVDQSLIYGDEFSCRSHWKNEEIRCKFMEVFTKLSQI